MLNAKYTAENKWNVASAEGRKTNFQDLSYILPSRRTLNRYIYLKRITNDGSNLY